MKPRQRGAALLLAMIILTLVATLAAGMVWQQSRSVQIEAAERGGQQAEWILVGALDWARLILREDTRSGGADHLGEPWATPLAEARLSSFLAVDRDNNADAGPDAFLSGTITDAQARYNLRNLIDGEGKIVEAEQKALARLCDAVGLPTDTPVRIAEGLRLAQTGAAATVADSSADAPLLPSRVSQLAWLGLDAATLARLEPYVVLLPVNTPVNANTASREVLVAAIDKLDLGTAERLVQRRQRLPFEKLDDIQKELPSEIKADEKRVNWKTSYFFVDGRLRLEDLVLEQRSLVERRGADRGLEVVALQSERRALQLAPR
ncbi:MAG: type II secretion system minor pseudopilin GspK [Rubrivivax sp.]